jgi:hypothetical protein
MPLPQPRSGVTLEVKGRRLPFSFFPVTRGKRRYGLYDALFAVNPWAVMKGAINERVTDAGERAEGSAFLQQAEDFYGAAGSRLSANPLLLYYSFLNLGKALLRVLGFKGSLGRAMHGLSEQLVDAGVELRDGQVVVRDSGVKRVNVYPELVEQLGFDRPNDEETYSVLEVLPQIVIGHRLWREARTTNHERFVAVDEIEIVKDSKARELWLRLYISRGDLTRYGITRTRLLGEGKLGDLFHEVDIGPTSRDTGLLCLEQKGVVDYSGRPTDKVMDLIHLVRPRLWRIVTTVPASAYRKYYVHLTPPGEARLPQLASLWVLFFYFGSVVRYRPHLFDGITAGEYGAFVTEFVSAQSEQFLYLLASEMSAREVAKPAIV